MNAQLAMIPTEAYKLVQPTKAKEQIGCSTRTLYDHAEKNGWEKVSLEGNKVAFKVPEAWIEEQGFNPVTQEQRETELAAFMRDMVEKIEMKNNHIQTLTVEAAQHRLLTETAESMREHERKQLLGRIFELEAQLKIKRKRLFGLF